MKPYTLLRRCQKTDKWVDVGEFDDLENAKQSACDDIHARRQYWARYKIDGKKSGIWDRVFIFNTATLKDKVPSYWEMPVH